MCGGGGLSLDKALLLSFELNGQVPKPYNDAISHDGFNGSPMKI